MFAHPEREQLLGSRLDVPVPQVELQIDGAMNIKPEVSYSLLPGGRTMKAVVRLRGFSSHDKRVDSILDLTARVAKSDSDVVYEVQLRNGRIIVNDFELSRPQFNSENEIVFSYILRNPNRRIEASELEDVLGHPLRKSLWQVLRDLGFKSDLRTVFFIGVSKSALHFINPVTRGDLDARGLGSARIPR